MSNFTTKLEMNGVYGEIYIGGKKKKINFHPVAMLIDQSAQP